MKKKKIALLLTSALILSTSLVGCNKNETNNPETEVETSTSEESTISVENIANDTMTVTEDTLETFITDDEISMDDLVASVKLCDYSNIDVNVTLTEVSEDDVTKEMNEYLSFFDAYEHIMEGTVEEGKTANITFVGTMNGEEFDGGSGTFDLEIGSNSFIDGFEDGLIGKNVGDKVTLDLTFPEDYSVTDLAGKAVQFDVTINYLLGDKIEAELTDEYLSSNTDYASVEELHDAAKHYLDDVALNTYLVERENTTLDYLIQNSEMPKVPRSYITDYVDNMKNYYQSMADMYGLDLSTMLESNLGVTEEEFNIQTKQSAVNYMQSAIVLRAIALKESIDVTDEEIDAYITDFATSNGYESKDELIEALESNNEMEEMKDEVLYNKVMKFVYDTNKLVLPEGIEEHNHNHNEINVDVATETTTELETETTTESESEMTTSE